MIPNSKQEKHYINNNNFFIGLIALSCIHEISFTLKSNNEHLKIRYP